MSQLLPNSLKYRNKLTFKDEETIKKFLLNFDGKPLEMLEKKLPNFTGLAYMRKFASQNLK